ncbi:MAG: alpha/beta fold hydrolase [Planctomycetota bacterium]|nr:alpha/beta fold hydrolase [Planctomycetota bacterium]
MYRIPGFHFEDHVFRLPLDHDDPAGGAIEVFGREVLSGDGAHRDRPWLVFLQGGPGFESPRPLASGGWLSKAVERYRVLLLDQRGTGRSTPQTPENITRLGGAAAQAEHLARFRADAIVRDCEAIRTELGIERWTVLGQSFGGFCAVHYLSSAPEGLAGVMITGGLPGLETSAEEVYRRTYPLTRTKNEQLFERFPQLEGRVRAVFDRLQRGDVTLPCGDPLTPERLQLVGSQLGFSYGAAQLHYLFERAFVPETDVLSRAFLRGVEGMQSFDTNPFYAILHEACYAQGGPTAWAAHRVREEYPEFAAPTAGGAPLFTGEMVYPWFLEQFGALRGLAEVGELLAAKTDWPRLYDPVTLGRNEVPVAALIYHDDMFVPAELSIETAGRIKGLDPWITNEHEHDGLRADGANVFEKLRCRL